MMDFLKIFIEGAPIIDVSHMQRCRSPLNESETAVYNRSVPISQQLYTKVFTKVFFS